MIPTKVYGIHGEGRILCPSCAERLYGSSLEMYLSAGEIQRFSESDRPTYASKGLYAMTARAGSSHPIELKTLVVG
jgi:hypothetical protein